MRGSGADCNKKGKQMNEAVKKAIGFFTPETRAVVKDVTRA